MFKKQISFFTFYKIIFLLLIINFTVFQGNSIHNDVIHVNQQTTGITNSTISTFQILKHQIPLTQ